ncbi:MAG TPA: hypothetical protein VIF62_22685 [Labilithrix sp.]
MPRRSKALTLLFHVFVAVLACVSSATPAAARRSSSPAVVAAAHANATVARSARATRPSPIAKAVDVAPTLPGTPATPRIASASWERVAADAAPDAPASRLAIDRPRARAPPR